MIFFPLFSYCAARITSPYPYNADVAHNVVAGLNPLSVFSYGPSPVALCFKPLIPKAPCAPALPPRTAAGAARGWRRRSRGRLGGGRARLQEGSRGPTAPPRAASAAHPRHGKARPGPPLPGPLPAGLGALRQRRRLPAAPRAAAMSGPGGRRRGPGMPRGALPGRRGRFAAGREPLRYRARPGGEEEGRRRAAGGGRAAAWSAGPGPAGAPCGGPAGAAGRPGSCWPPAPSSAPWAGCCGCWTGGREAAGPRSAPPRRPPRGAGAAAGAAQVRGAGLGLGAAPGEPGGPARQAPAARCRPRWARGPAPPRRGAALLPRRGARSPQAVTGGGGSAAGSCGSELQPPRWVCGCRQEAAGGEFLARGKNACLCCSCAKGLDKQRGKKAFLQCLFTEGFDK